MKTVKIYVLHFFNQELAFNSALDLLAFVDKYLNSEVCEIEIRTIAI